MRSFARPQGSRLAARLSGCAALLAAAGGLLAACTLDPLGTGPAAGAPGGGGSGGGSGTGGGTGGGAGAGAGGGAGGEGGAPAVCGDGVVQPSEKCDDGGSAPGDGCSASCAVEPGYTCADGEPSVCAPIEAEVVSTGPGLALAISDGGYNGTPGSMACVTLDFPDKGFTSIQRVELVMGIDHGWVGDLVVKVESPVHTWLTVVSRPGVNENVDGYYGPDGDSSIISGAHPITFRDGAPYPAEDLGNQIVGNQTVCLNDGRCEYAPSHGAGPGVNFADFNLESPVGPWRVCAGDGDSGYAGSIDSVSLSILAW